jgi:putative colanic acid biosynthesis acetyltransferase WcaF
MGMSESSRAPQARKTNTHLDLSRFPRPILDANPGHLRKALWYLIAAVLFQHSLALLPSRLKTIVLKAFGADVGRNAVIKPRVTIKYPWLLSVGDNCWIGENVWIDNPGRASIGSNVCISQGSYIVTGNHDYADPTFPFYAMPIEIGDRCWICARAILPPGSILQPGTVVSIGSVWQNVDTQPMAVDT